MPSASAKVEKQADFLESFKQAVVVVEHKIRNLEKRKGKLDAYKLEQEQGKELNADQLAAVAKYNEVVQQLDFSRDIVKQLTQIGEETNRAYRKQQKKELADKATQETDRFRQLLLFQGVLDTIVGNQRARQDFLNGAEGTVKLTQDDLNALDEFASLISPAKDSLEYAKLIENAAEHISALFQGRTKPVAGKNYKELQALLLSISSCEYFGPKRLVKLNDEQVVPEDVSAPLTASPTVTQAPVSEPVPAQIIHAQQESTYNFMQESQIDISSPHMDPAVVAISSFPPPPLQAQQQDGANQNVYNAVENMNNRLNDLSLSHQNNKNEEDNEWDESIPNQTFTNSGASNAPDANGRGDTGNSFDRTARGNSQYRGRGGRRGMSNGYARDRGSSRGRGNYQNGRGGYRSDYRNDRSDGDADSNVFDANSRNTRPKRRGGYSNYSNNVSQSATHNDAYSAAASDFGAAPTGGSQTGQPRPSRTASSQQQGRVNTFSKQ